MSQTATETIPFHLMMHVPARRSSLSYGAWQEHRSRLKDLQRYFAIWLRMRTTMKPCCGQTRKAWFPAPQRTRCLLTNTAPGHRRYCGADDSYTTYFIDVPESAYYYKAVAWASNRYVVSGTTLQKFSPYSTCTRAQIVTMLYRMQRSDTEALRTGDIQSVHIENLAINSELTLTEWEIDEFKAIVSRAALNNNPQPQFGQGQTSNPMYVVHI